MIGQCLSVALPSPPTCHQMIHSTVREKKSTRSAYTQEEITKLSARLHNTHYNREECTHTRNEILLDYTSINGEESIGLSMQTKC